VATTIGFDLDGTLSDWEAGIRAAAPRAADRLLAVLDGLHPREEGGQVDGAHYLLFVRGPEIWAEALGLEEAEALARDEAFRAAWRAVPFADVEPTLAALHGRHRLALITNSPRAEAELAAMGLTDWFDDVVALPPELRKPNPEGYRYACRQLGIEPDELLYVGDSYRCDVQGGLQAGVHPIWVDRWATTHPVPEGVVRLTSLKELPAVVA